MRCTAFRARSCSSISRFASWIVICSIAGREVHYARYTECSAHAEVPPHQGEHRAGGEIIELQLQPVQSAVDHHGLARLHFAGGSPGPLLSCEILPTDPCPLTEGQSAWTESDLGPRLGGPKPPSGLQRARARHAACVVRASMLRVDPIGTQSEW